MASEPDEAELLRRAIENRLLDFHTSIPAIVDNYNRTGQVIDAKVCLKRTIAGDTQKTIFEELAILRNIRVKFPKGRDADGNVYYMAFPLEKGSPVDLVFDEQYAGQYRETGNVPSETLFAGRFNLSSCWAIPGGGANSDAITDILDDKTLVIGIQGGPQIHIKFDGDNHAPTINLGPAVESAAGQAAKIADKLNAIVQCFTGLTPAVPVGPDAGEPGLTALIVAIHAAFPSPVTEQDVGATTVFVK